MKKLWSNWKKINNKILDKEASIILTILYFILLAPYAIVTKIFSDPLNIKIKKESYWYDKNTKSIKDIESLKRQY